MIIIGQKGHTIVSESNEVPAVYGIQAFLRSDRGSYLRSTFLGTYTTLTAAEEAMSELIDNLDYLLSPRTNITVQRHYIMEDYEDDASSDN